MTADREPELCAPGTVEVQADQNYARLWVSVESVAGFVAVVDEGSTFAAHHPCFRAMEHRADSWALAIRCEP